MPAAVKSEAAPSSFAERRRQQMQQNAAVLKGIATTASEIKIEKPKPAPRPPAKRKAAAPVRKQPARPTRISARLSGIEADSEVEKRKLEMEAEEETERRKAKKMRNGDDLKLGDIAVDGRKFGGLDGIKDIFARGADPGVRTFTAEDVKEITDAGLKDLRERMSALELYEHWLPNDIKITPTRIYALGFHPTEDKPVVFAGDKEGAVGVFDASQTAPDADDEDDDDHLSNPTISAFKTHTRTITSFVFSSTDHNAVFTSSYDSSVRRTDLEKTVSTQVWAPKDPSEDMPISALDMPANEPDLLYFSTLAGELGRHDMRTPDDTEIWTLSDHKIGGFSLHPLQPHLVATASLDRTVKIWDLRKISGKGDLRHPALLGEHESRLSVSHAAWSAGGHLATSSYDDTVKIYDFSDSATWKAGHDIGETSMKPAHTVRHNNQTGRWVTILKPQWQKRPTDGIQKFVIGNMNRFVDVFASDGSQLAQLDGEGITAVPAVAHFHPTMDWVAGGTGSGKLCFWR